MENTKKQNIILICLDGARIDQLKFIDDFKKISSKGTLFDNVITYCAQTNSSLHAIFTGIYGNQNGVNNYFGSLKFKKDQCKTLTTYLKENGYYTIGDALNEIVLPQQGFIKFKAHNEFKDDLLKKHKLLLNKAKNINKKGENFFLYLHYSYIHTYLAKNIFNNFDNFDEEYFNNKEKNLENYNIHLRKACTYLKNIFDECKTLKLLENSIFVVFSDHGCNVGEKKGEIGYGRLCYDFTLKTFLLFVKEDFFPKKIIINLARTIDIMPTLMEVVDIKEETLGYKKIQGMSLLPWIKDDKYDERIAFSEAAGFVNPSPSKEKPRLKCIRTKDWKFIYNVKTGKKELYNLKEDPNEENNLINTNKEIEEKLLNNLRELDPGIDYF